MRIRRIIITVTLAVATFLYVMPMDVISAPKTSTPTAPTISCSPTAPTKGNVTVTIYYPKAAAVKQYKIGINGVWAQYTAPVVITSNTYFAARYQNSSNIWSVIKEVTISNIDRTPPSDPTFAASTNQLTNQNVTVTIGFSQDSTVKQYRLEGSTTWSNYTSPVTLSSNNTIYAKAADAAGNLTSITSYTVSNIDKDIPSTPILTSDKTEPTNGDVNISIWYPTDASVKQYKIGASGIWTDYLAPVVVSVNNTIYAKAMDSAGNWSLEGQLIVSNIDSEIVSAKTVIGYTVKYSSADTSSYNSLVANSSTINVIATATYGVDGYGTLSGAAPTDQITFANNNGIKPYLMISNNFDSSIAKQLLESSVNRQNLINNILNLLNTYNYKGVDIDIENIPAADRNYFTTFMSEVYSTLKPLGYGVSVTVAAKTNDSPYATWNYAFDYKSLAMYSDYLMIMAYDEHYPGGTPGAVASINFVTNVVDYALTVVPKEKIILGLAAYGYDWYNGTTKAYSINSCYNIAANNGATVYLDSATKSKYFTYTASGISHTVWFEDAETISYKLDLVNSRDLKGIGIWRLGLENTYYWDAIKTKLNK